MKPWLLPLCLSGALVACERPPPPADTLRAAVPVLPPSWGDPFRAEVGPPIATWSAMFDGLTRLDANGQIVPALAESWSSPDGKQWTFTLRQGLKFSDGTRADAPAVAETFRWLMTKDGKASVIGGRVRGLKTVETPDEQTLIIELSKPDAIFYKRLPAVMIVGADAWKRLGPVRFAKRPVGTGPYRLVRFDERGRKAILQANPHGWRKAGIAKLEIIELADEAVRQQALISGEIDVARVGLDGAPLMRARGVDVVAAPAMTVMSMAFLIDGQKGPLTDPRVRRALNYAVDKETLSRQLLGGRARPAGQPAALGTTGYNPAIGAYAHDPARARALLAQAGYARGFDLELAAMIGNMPSDALIYQAVANDLSKVGVRARIRAVPYPVYLHNYARNAWGSASGFGAAWQATPTNDVQRPMEGFSCLRKNTSFCDKALTARLTAASKEMNVASREALLQQVSLAYHDAAPALFLVEQVDVFGTSARVEGLSLANRTPVYERVRFKTKP